MDSGPRPPQPPKNGKLPPLRRQRAMALMIVGSSLLAAVVIFAVIGFTARPQTGPVIHRTDIGQVLTLIDQHSVRSATIDGNTVTITTTSGQQYAATKEDGQQLTLYLYAHGVTKVANVPPVDGMPSWVQAVMEVLLFVLLGLLVLAMLRRNSGGGTGQAVPFGRSRAVRFNETHPTVLFKDVAGVEEAKDELQEIVHFLKYPDKFRKMGARIPKGVLLVGPPGTGKTLISRAVAGEAGVAFYSVSGSEFVEMFVGVGASRVRDLFKMAKENTPCIVFIDEIDAVGRQRGGMPTTGNDEREQTLNQLLVEMDGFDKHDNVVVIAATNRPDVLDHALLRPGRFDRQVMLEKPDLAGRTEILRVHADGKPLAPHVNMERLARQTTGMSGADLANVLNEAALLAARRDRELVEQQDLEEAILRVVAGPERKSHVLTEAEKAIVAYHEMGHAIVMRMLPGCDHVQKVSTVSRGMALGITVQAPNEDRSLLRRSELLAKLAGLMGGRAAEEIIFGDITTGAAQDIKQATNIARRMVREFGMSPLGNVLLEDDGISPELTAKVDAEIAQLVDQAYATAKDILTEKRDKLVEIAEYLMQVETIDGPELDQMLFGTECGRPIILTETEDSAGEPLTLEEIGRPA
jgi:cell division protease FtsH